jgi:O-antigen/teichoic acid export membrane protein
MMIVLPVLSGTNLSPDRFAVRGRATVAVMAPLGALVASATFGGAALAIATIGGADFEEARTPLRILSAMLLLAYPAQVYGYALLASRRHGAMLAAVCAGLATSGVLLLLLVPDHGATGGAIALVAGQAVILLMYAGAYWRWNDASGHLSTLLLSFVAYGLSAGVAVSLPGSWLPLVAAVTISVAILALPVRTAVRNALRVRST